MSEVLTPDICVIGAGSGGLSVAAAAAAFGVSVVLIEKGKMGGDCLNYGCVPSKAILAAGKAAQSIRDAVKFGVGAQEPSVNFRKVHDHIHGVIAQIAPMIPSNDSLRSGWISSKRRESSLIPRLWLQETKPSNHWADTSLPRSPVERR